MPSHPVKWYSSAMPGAPALRNVAGDLIAVLDWCIVNGSATTAVQSLVVAVNVATGPFASAHTFPKHQIIEIAGVTGALTALNSQWRVTSVTSLTLTFAATGIANGTAAGTITCKTPSVGWQKAFSGTNKAAYRSQDVTGTRLYLRVDDTGTTTAIPTGYESMSGVDVGTNLFQPSSNNGIYKSFSSAPAPWFVVADARSAYWCVAVSGLEALNNVYGGGFGDFDDYAVGSQYGCVLGAYLAGQAGILSPGGAAGIVAARGYSLAPGEASLERGATPVANGAYPNPVDSGLLTLRPVLLVESSNVRGALRGVLEVLPNAGPAVGTIIDSGVGYDGLAMIVATSGENPRSGGGRRSAIDLVGPW
jgi:hypothetical protein